VGKWAISVRISRVAVLANLHSQFSGTAAI